MKVATGGQDYARDGACRSHKLAYTDLTTHRAKTVALQCRRDSASRQRVSSSPTKLSRARGAGGVCRMKGAELLVAEMENEGVQQIFGVPGEENLDVVEALRGSTIKLVVTRHEQAAAFMAATHGRLRGRPGICLFTLGPGALNLTTGAAHALLVAMAPILS